MWKNKDNGYEYNYSLYITKPYRDKRDRYILVISIVILFFLILIVKQSLDMINRKNAYTLYLKQAVQAEQEQKRQEEQKKQEEARKQEEYKKMKMPKLTEEGKQNLENIYHSETK